MQKTTESGIIRKFANVVCEKILSNFKPVAHMTQEITTIYPGRRYGNSLSTGLYAGAEEGKSFTSVRNCLVPVPEGVTVEQVTEQLKKFPDSVIQRITSNNINDVLTKNDEWAMNTINPETGQPYKTLDELKDQYETRDKEGNRFSNGAMRVSAVGELLDESLVPEYSRSFYQNSYVEDKDLREKILVEQPVAAMAQTLRA